MTCSTSEGVRIAARLGIGDNGPNVHASIVEPMGYGVTIRQAPP